MTNIGTNKDTNSTSGSNRRQMGRSVEPSTCGTSWGSIRWNRPISDQGICYRTSRFLGNNSTFELMTNGKSSTPTSNSDRFKRNTILDMSNTSRPEYFYLTTRSPARNTLLDIRQNLRPVKRELEQRYSRPKYVKSSTPLNDFAKKTNNASSASYMPYSVSSSAPPINFTTATPSSSSAHTTAVKSAIVSSSLAISNAMAQHRPIPKSERPWRQRLADAAQMRQKKGENSALSSAYSVNETILRSARPSYASGNKSSSLVAIQQRKIQETAEQNLQEQLAELRNIVAEDKMAYRYSRRNEQSDAPSRRDSNASAFSMGSHSSFAGSTASFNSALSSMPSAIRARHNVNTGEESRLYASNLHPSYTSTIMSKNQTPIHSSNVFMHAAKLDKINGGKFIAKSAPMAAMEESTTSNEDIDKDKNINSIAKKKNLNTLKNIKSSEKNIDEKDRKIVGDKNNGEQNLNENTLNAEAPPKKRTTVKRILEISSSRKNIKEEIKNPASESLKMVCKFADENSTSPTNNEKSGNLASGEQKSSRKVNERTTNEKVEEKSTKEEELRTTKDTLKVISFNDNVSTEELPIKNSSIVDDNDEGQYNAVTQFKPASMLCRKTFTIANNAASPAAKIHKKRPIAPVPGTWSSTSGEHYISYNRHLYKPSCVINVEVVCKHFLCEHIAKSSLREASNILAKKIRSATLKFDKLKSISENSNAPMRNIFLQKKLANALAVLNCEFANKKRFRLGIQKSIRPYRLSVENVCLNCIQPKNRKIALVLNIIFREQSRNTLAKILSVSANKMIAQTHANILFHSIAKTRKKPSISALNKENFAGNKKNSYNQRIISNVANKPKMIQLDKRAAKKTILEPKKETIQLNEQLIKTDSVSVKSPSTLLLGQPPTFIKNTHVPYSVVSNSQQQTDPKNKSTTTTADAKKQVINYTVIPFVLPNESLLEEYVKRKRNELEKCASYALNSNAFIADVTLDNFSRSSTSASRCESPPSASSSFTSSSVQISVLNYDHSNKNDISNQQFIATTKPPTSLARNKNVSLMPDEVEQQKTPRITDLDLLENEKMIELLSFNNPAILAGAVEKLEKFEALKSKAPLNQQIKSTRFEPQKQHQAVLLKNLRKPIDVVKKVNVFDAPKSLFEKRMQNQAANLKRTSANNPQQNSVDFPVVYEETNDKLLDQNRRRTSNDKLTVTQNFTAAIASQQPRHQLERYAAHIPMSGRQSTTSIDSNNSGTLDSASCSIDQMIDQARYRHHQQSQPQNGKFKEAIDYLDQIFEDLRNECDMPITKNDKSVEKNGSSSLNNNNNNKTETIISDVKKMNGIHSSRTLPKSTNRIQQQDEQFPKNAFIVGNISNWKKNTAEKSQSTSKGVPNQHERQLNNQYLKQKELIQELTNAESSEMKQSAKKGKENRLDFTRKWLVNDSKLWGADADEHLITNLTKKKLKNNSENSTGEVRSLSGDSEHSLGSCSAEVAAINAAEKTHQKPSNTKTAQYNKKTTKVASKSSLKPTKVLEKKKSEVIVIEPIRPQPFRPQAAQIPSGLGSSDYDLYRMPSTDRLNGVQFRSSSQNRASSRNQHSMGSTHSQEGIKPTESFLSINSLQRGNPTGAFVNYPQRGSIQSLPDAALLQNNNRPQVVQQIDMTTNQSKIEKKNTTNNKLNITNSKFATELELDSLVAELELNTYSDDISDKRRSFPIVQAEKSVGNMLAIKQKNTSVIVPNSNANVQETMPRTNSMGRRAYPSKAGANSVGAITGNAASIGTVIGQAAITAQYKQRQRLNAGANSSVSPTRRITSNGTTSSTSIQKITSDNAEKRRQSFSLEQKVNEKISTELDGLNEEKEKSLAPTSYKSIQQQQSQHRKFSGGSTGSSSIEKGSSSPAANPFETINQERFKPSRVEAIQHMFEKSSGQKKESWARKTLHPNSNSSKDEPTYCEIGEYKKNEPKNSVTSQTRTSERPKLRSVNIHPVFCQEEKQRTSNSKSDGIHFRKSSQQNNERKVVAPISFTNVQPPTSAPPRRPPPPAFTSQVDNAECSGHRNSMKLPTIVTTPATEGNVPLTPNANRHSRSDSLFGRLSAGSGSHAPSLNSATVDDEDDGFYDNIPVNHHLSSLALSEVGDNASLSSQQLPPSSTTIGNQKSGGRQFIGKLIRKIGEISGNNGGGDHTLLDAQRPPTSAASLVSLNKVGDEKLPQRNVGLMKSNSLSYDPWKSAARHSTESIDAMHSDREDADRNGGFGNRLKQTIFGSKRRVTAHS